MKTKTNKVPLVGPKGRRELLDRIEELEKKVIELAQNPPQKMDIIDIVQSFDGKISEETAISNLRLNGKQTTKEELSSLNPTITVIRHETNLCPVAILNSDGDVLDITAGYCSSMEDAEYSVWIYLDGNNSYVKISTY